MIDALKASPVSATAAVSPTQAKKDADLKSVSVQLAGVFTQQLYKAMRDTVSEKDGIVAQSSGEDIFTSLMDGQVAAETPKQWDGSIAAAIYKQLHGLASPSGTAASPTPPVTTAP